MVAPEWLSSFRPGTGPPAAECPESWVCEWKKPEAGGVEVLLQGSGGTMCDHSGIRGKPVECAGGWARAGPHPPRKRLVLSQ